MTSKEFQRTADVKDGKTVNLKGINSLRKELERMSPPLSDCFQLITNGCLSRGRPRVRVSSLPTNFQRGALGRLCINNCLLAQAYRTKKLRDAAWPWL